MNNWTLCDNDGNVEYFRTKAQALHALAGLVDADTVYHDDWRVVDPFCVSWISETKPTTIDDVIGELAELDEYQRKQVAMILIGSTLTPMAAQDADITLQRLQKIVVRINGLL